MTKPLRQQAPILQVAAYPLSNSRRSLDAFERTLTAKISDYAMTVSDFAIFVDSTQGPVSITLSSASSEGKMVFVQKVDSSNNAVLVKCLEGDGIDLGVSLRASSQWEGWALVADGAKTWFVVSKSNSFVFQKDEVEG
jgi:hypothetical protein